MVQKQILIVDDDPGLCFMLKKRLEFEGDYLCTCVQEADAALEMISKSRPDLIILDLNIGRFDGTAVLKNVREWLPENLNPPPMIILSGYDEKEIVDYCIECGAKGFMKKSADLSTLVSMVNEYAHVA